MRILNIGSGPITPGIMPGLDIVCADRRDYGESVVRENMEHLTYPDGTFDLVVCINALDHTPDPQAAIKEMVRVSKGWVYIDWALIQHTTSGRNHYWDALEDGTFVTENNRFNIKDYGFTVELIDNAMERRYDHIICKYNHSK